MSSLKRLHLAVLSALLLAVWIWLAAICSGLMNHPPVWPDEALFAGPAQSAIAGEGTGTNLMQGAAPGIESTTHWVPPFYFLVLAGWFQLLGVSIESMRLLSVAIACFGFATLFWVGCRLALPWPLRCVLVMLVALDPTWIRASTLGRMDLLSLTLALASLALATGDCETKPRELTAASGVCPRRRIETASLASGLLASLALLTHPIGVAAIVASFVASAQGILRRDGANGTRPAARLCHWLIGLAIPLLPWLVWAGTTLDLFIAQWQLQLVRKASRAFDFWGRFARLPSGYSEMREAAHLIWLAALVAWAWLARQFPNARPHFVAHCSWLLLLWFSDEMWYSVYMLPTSVIALLWLTAIGRERSRESSGPRTWGRALLVIPILALSVMGGTALVILWQRGISLSPAAVAGVITEVREERTPYHHFVDEIAALLPVEPARVHLACIPDPSLPLSLARPELRLQHFSPLPMDAAKRDARVLSARYIVQCILPIPTLDLIDANGEITVASAKGPARVQLADIGHAKLPGTLTDEAIVYRVTPVGR